jgi:hypothetical protein
MSTETQLQLLKLDFAPGFHRESTQYAEQGKWYDGDRVRFRAGKPENIGGWNFKVSNSFEGTGRDLINWEDNDTLKRASFGTESKLYTYFGGVNYDITPITSTVTVTNKLTTASGSTKVLVSAANTLSTGDFVEFTSMAATIGGNVFFTSGSDFKVSVINSNSFEVLTSTTAAATSAAAGVVTINFLLPVGTSTAVAGLGWNAGYYGQGGYGEAKAQSDITILPRQWTLDTWGEDLVAGLRGGHVYYWETSAGIESRAIEVSAAPSVSNTLIVSQEDRHLICMGTNEFTGGAFNPLLVRWSNQNDFNNWTPSVSSTSGEAILGSGNRIVAAARSRNNIIILTDKSAHTMQFIGPPFTFGFNEIGTNCGAAGLHAAKDFDGRVYWMGTSNFYVFDGTVKNLPCTVRRFVFDDINLDQSDKIFAGINSQFKEITWLYCSKTATECDRYVTFNPNENYWVYGSTHFTTFVDRGVFSNSITTGVETSSSLSYLYDNEPEGIYTANGSKIQSFVESSDFDMSEGNEIMFIDRMVPDMTISNEVSGTSGQVNLQLTTKRYPNATDSVLKGPFTVEPTTSKISMRARGRQAKIRVATSTLGTSWRYGTIRLDIGKDGMR